MYNFIDTTEVSAANMLPSEALMINGEYIENLIPGYRTLNVRGREALSPDIETFETGYRDGTKIKNKKYPERIITIKYQMILKTNEEFREAFNKLGGILNVTDAELIFNDEQDKYFIGTPCGIGEVEPGRNAVIGEFEILCVDPFKYSTTEYVAETNENGGDIAIDYNGTYKCFPVLEAEMYKEDNASEDGETEVELLNAGDCGYVAFFTEDEKIIQLGNPAEVDGIEDAFPKSQTLATNGFKTASAWGAAAKNQWKLNNGQPVNIATTHNGNLAMSVATTKTVVNKAKTITTTVFSKKSLGVPFINYTLSVTASGRTATSVKLQVKISAKFAEASNYMYYPYRLAATVGIGGNYYGMQLKSANDRWDGGKTYTKQFSVTVSGLTASQETINNISFKVSRQDNMVGVETTNYGGVLNELTGGKATIGVYSTVEPVDYILSPSSYGSGTGWHGASITRILIADASGEAGAKQFSLTWEQKMCIGNASNASNQYGAFQVAVLDANDVVIAGISIVKNTTGKTARLTRYVNGVAVSGANIDLSYNNAKLNIGKTATIRKAANGIYINVAGIGTNIKKPNANYTAVADLSARKVVISFAQYGTKPALAYNGLYSVKFVKDNCETYREIPNKFTTGDIVKADCRSGEIFLNGVAEPSLGALGNNFEEFVLTPGINFIGTACSEWIEPDFTPTFRVKYREVFL